jgi:serine/threonine protein kinase
LQDLFSRLAVMGQFTELHASAVIATIVNAVHFCHCHGIAHRDLKPANLLMKDESENSNLCLVDFGAGYVMDSPDNFGAPLLAAGRPDTSSESILPGLSGDLQRQSMKTITGELASRGTGLSSTDSGL